MDKDKIPVFELDVNEFDETGVYGLSFVDSPANEVQWMKFSKEPLKAQFSDDEHRILTSVVMQPGKNILRFREDLGFFYVKFSAEGIERMVKKFAKDVKGFIQLNEQHDSDRPIEGVHLMESYIIGRGVKNEFFPDVPEGAWMMSFYVEDPVYWERVKTEGFNGFSLEGIWDMFPAQFSLEDLESRTAEMQYDAIKEILESGEAVDLSKIQSILKK